MYHSGARYQFGTALLEILMQKKTKARGFHAVILVAAATIAWAISVGMTYSSSIGTVPDPTPCNSGCKGESAPLSREALAALLQQKSTNVSFAPATAVTEIEPGDNCAKTPSCGERLGCWRVFGGGSQYVYGNKIPACLRDSDQKCYDVRCRVKQYSNRNCSGEPDEDSYVDRRGCKKQTAVGSETVQGG